MVRIKVTDKQLWDTPAKGLVFFLEDKFSWSRQLKEASEQYFPDLKELMKEQKFTGKSGNLLVVPVPTDGGIVHLIFAGFGAKQGRTHDVEDYRRALGKVIQAAKKHRLHTLAFALPSARLFGVTTEYLAKETAIIADMALYRFDDYLDVAEEDICSIDISLITSDKKAAQRGVKEGEVIAESVNLARYWVDLPPNQLVPEELSFKAKEIVKEGGLKIKVFGEKQIGQMGMGGLEAVSRGSHRDCQLVIMEYKAAKKSAPTIAFVGKGITFDSGGLSLKPPVHMETMKEDMSGAAAVIASMKAIAKLKPNVNIVALTPISENLPSGQATKPGDICRFYNGKTAEIKNTDAEGRLVLADALSYAVKHYKPAAMIDLATLTGACAYALGPFFTGMMSQHDKFADRVKKAGDVSGDKVWPLPFHDDYKAAIKSDIADISNIGSRKYMAGAITAGFFLKNFVGDTPWVHLDIAGTAFNVPDRSYYSSGATGVGVRLLVELAMSWK